MSEFRSLTIVKNPLADILSSRDFSPEEYVKELSMSGECVGVQDLRARYRSVHGLSEETSQALKRNVYRNYAQFIETSKEISFVEAEMYQLSHQLTEERSLLKSFQSLSMSSEDEKALTEEKDEKASLASVLEVVEGCSHLAEVPGRYVMHQGSVMQLSSDGLQPQQLMRAFLLNDTFMLAIIMKKRRGPIRYRFVSLFELDSLAVADLKDTNSVKNAFKILLFPNYYIFQTETPEEKAQWLQSIDISKQMLRFLADKRISSTDDALKDEKVQDLLSIEFLKTVAEDLDVFIAQHNFEAAVELVQKTRDYLAIFQHSQQAREIRNRVESRVKQISQQLISELQGATGTAGHSNASAVRRVVIMLVNLGRSAKACDLFLNNRSRVISYDLQQLKIEDNVALYVSKLSTTFFQSLADGAEEFQKAFSGNNDSTSALVAWAIKEIQKFVKHFNERVFSAKPNMHMVVECIDLACKNCDKLNKVGLDLTFHLQSLLIEPMTLCFGESSETLMNSCLLFAQAESWECLDLSKKPDQQLSQLILEMNNFGIDDFSNLIFAKDKVDLSETTVDFCKLVFAFVNDSLIVCVPELYETFISCLSNIFSAQIEIIEGALKDDTFLPNRSFILKNSSFILDTVLSVIEEKVEDTFGRTMDDLADLHEDLKLRIDEAAEGDEEGESEEEVF